MEQPAEIGPYRILDILGEGGMGVVYLAEQSEPVRRRVALKLIKLGMDSKAVVARFEQERQALALMDHEGIAKVYDCGTSERGHPFFVMELVKGDPLEQFCEQNRLSIPDRLKVMQQVCGSVQHAHQKGVIHRDLKPGNVLVSNHDGRFQTKIIDFGLAKAMGQKLIEATLFTEAGQVVGTPEYMAPEQADPTNADIDTRADIYSLGVMLYELLVGELPFPAAGLRKAGMLEVQRILREVDPPKPSTKLTAFGDASTEVAHKRRISVGALKKALQGDLDWVVLKALEKDRMRRYETASALRADLQRFLDHEPLVAGPPSAGYRLRKLVRRYRGQVVTGSLLLLTMLGGGAGTLLQWWRAEQKADRLAEEKSVSEAIANFFANEILIQASPDLNRDGVLLIDVVDAAAKSLGDRFEVRPEIALRLHGALAATYASLTSYAKAEAQYERVLQLYRVGSGPDRVEKYVVENDLASVLWKQGKLEAAERLFRSALQGLERHQGSSSPNVITTRNNIGCVLRDRGEIVAAREVWIGLQRMVSQAEGIEANHRLMLCVNLSEAGRLLDDHDAADTWSRQAIGLIGEGIAPGSLAALQAWNNRAVVLLDRDPAEAQKILERIEPEVIERCGQHHHLALTVLHNLGRLRCRQENYGAAVTALEKALDGKRQKLGSESASTRRTMNELIDALIGLGQGARAEALLVELRALGIRAGDLNDDDFASIDRRSGHVLLLAGEVDRGLQALRDSIAAIGRMHGLTSTRYLRSLNDFAVTLREYDHKSEALQVTEQAAAGFLATMGPEDPNTLTTQSNLALMLSESGQRDEAVSMFRQVLEIERRVLGPTHRSVLTTINNLAACLSLAARYEEAAPLLDEAYRGLRMLHGDSSRITMVAALNLADFFAQQKDDASAQPYFARVIRHWDSAPPGDGEFKRYIWRAYGELLVRLEQPEAAEGILLEALAMAPSEQFVSEERVRLLRSLCAVYRGLARTEQAATYRDLLETEAKKPPRPQR